MASRPISLREAKRSVKRYRSEAADLMDEHRMAMDCRNCEDFLQMGINAFDWIIRADKVVREAMYNGCEEIDADEFEDAIRLLSTKWLEPCERANEWVKAQLKRGYRVENADRFRECCAEMQAIVAAQNEGDALPDCVAELRDAAIQEHGDGQTAEFV